MSKPSSSRRSRGRNVLGRVPHNPEVGFRGWSGHRLPRRFPPVVLRSNTLLCLENVGSQFLSLRHCLPELISLRRSSRLHSAIFCRSNPRPIDAWRTDLDLWKPGTSTVAADPRTGKIASKIAALAAEGGRDPVKLCDTSSNIVVDVAIKKAASVALDQPTGDCHGDRPYGGAQIDFHQLRDLANGQRTCAGWRFVSSISDGTQHGQPPTEPQRSRC